MRSAKFLLSPMTKMKRHNRARDLKLTVGSLGSLSVLGAKAQFKERADGTKPAEQKNWSSFFETRLW
jgi:hypothetical protein